MRSIRPRAAESKGVVIPVRLFYCDHIPFPLPEGHKFPLRKYSLVRQLLQPDPQFTLTAAQFASVEDLQRVHTPEYLASFVNGSLDPSISRKIGFPWSRELVDRTLASCGGTLAAVRAALESGFAGTLAGGTHHAFRSEGSGFCVFNDLAVATEWARQCAGLERIAIVDLDVHQGDGTASIFEGDSGVFTLSLHGGRNFPFRKQRSHMDVEFADGAAGADYLPALAESLETVWSFRPQLVLYQSGVDGLASDKLGRLGLTAADLLARDRAVFSGAIERRIPVAVTMGGGYSEPIELTVQAHAQTYRTGAEIFASVPFQEVS